MQFAFGSGAIWGTPLTDSGGNTITTPTPVRIGVVQDALVDISWTTKQLFGTTQFPVAVGRGTAKCTGTIKNAQVNGAIWNTIVFGQTLSSQLASYVRDVTGAAIPASGPYTITPTPPSSGTFGYDLGVSDSNGIQYTKVTSGPTSGQYSVSAGVYTFAAADTGKTVFIDYEYTATSTVAKTSTLTGPLLGYVPSFQMDLFVPFQGKTCRIRMYNAVATKLALATKLEDFIIPDMALEFFANAAGQLMDYSLSE
jgi:hypothetical protein